MHVNKSSQIKKKQIYFHKQQVVERQQVGTASGEEYAFNFLFSMNFGHSPNSSGWSIATDQSGDSCLPWKKYLEDQWPPFIEMKGYRLVRWKKRGRTSSSMDFFWPAQFQEQPCV